jgi:hypothetical protein
MNDVHAQRSYSDRTQKNARKGEESVCRGRWHVQGKDKTAHDKTRQHKIRQVLFSVRALYLVFYII